MVYSFRIFRLVLAAWVGLLSPLWCCCAVWGDSAGQVSAESAPMPTRQNGCSGCTSKDQDGHQPAQNQSSRPDGPCHCEHHQNIDAAVPVPVIAPIVVSPQPPLVVDLLPHATRVLSFGPSTVLADIRGAPPNGGPQSLFSLYCLLLV